MYSSCRRLPISSNFIFIGFRRAHFVPKDKPFNKRDQFGNIGYQAIQVTKLASRHQYRTPNERIIDDKWEHYQFNSDIPVIEAPLLKKYAKKGPSEALDKFSEAQGIDLRTANVIIRCARKEFNHYEGMRYSQVKGEFPLVSHYWYKNKYADDWFIVRRTQSIHVSMQESLDRTWEEFVHLIHPQIFQNITAMRFKYPTKVQYDFFKAYPNVKHVFMAGETGSGKTLAYGAPILSKLICLKERQPNAKALILTPSKQLRDQTVEKLQELAENTTLKIASPIKGENYAAEDFDVLVSTPGFAYNILKKLGDSVSVQYVVMDESDMMLDDSFVTDITNILSVVPIKFTENSNKAEGGAQLILSSATCPPELTDLVNEIVDSRHMHYVTSRHIHRILPNVEQKFIRVREKNKVDRLVQIIMNDVNLKKHRILVFCKDNDTASFLSDKLSTQHGFPNLLISKRGKEYDALSDESRILISTDVGSRGLDIENLTNVINYDFPKNLVDYIHRIGRVGRCNSGANKSFVTSFVRLDYEVEHVKAIELAIRLDRPIRGIETNVAAIQAEYTSKHPRHPQQSKYPTQTENSE